MAASVGDQRALEIYTQLCIYTENQCAELSLQKQLWYSDYIEISDEWSNDNYSKFLQEGNDLGQRLKHAFAQSFVNSEKVLVIGTDCPQITTEHILHAEEALNYVDIVIGPALDGGYYLLGMKQLHKEIFEEIDWSSDQVLRQTLQKIGQLKLSCKLLERLSDIDYVEDWEKYGLELEPK